MIVDVAIPVQLPDGIAVPASALIESGTRSTVIVDKGGDVFEEKQVVTGWRLGNDVQIVSGLSSGDVVITSGTFLMNAQMRIQQRGPSR
jgi:Cu(I)/Ag(I) efflux system membrane fusion protein